MARTLIVEVPITVQDDEQAALIFEAVRNGMAETAIKDKVLFGVQPPSSQPAYVDSEAKAAKEAEAAKQLMPLGPVASKAVIKPKVDRKPERTRGVMGRTKIGRTGGNR